MNAIARTLVRAYVSRELPGWGRVLKWASVTGERFDAAWANASTVTIRGKTHGYLMRLDLSDWAQCMTFFLGRYYEKAVLMTLDLVLKPGDKFADIGANIGMITLHARSLVGSTGRVECFEPLPQCVARIREHLALNELEDVVVHSVALSDEPGWLPIHMTSAHTGTATMASVPDHAIQQCLQVEVRTGDAELPDDVDVIKIDVEGYELHVLRGIAHTIDRCLPVIIMELVECQLKRAGTSVAEVSQFLLERGYVRYGIGSVRRGVGHELSLTSVTGDWSHDDALFVHPSRNVGLSRFVA
jgi:FkbM family methyltransferase